MSDTFHEEAGEESIDAIMRMVQEAYWHNFYVLTKRSKRMLEYFEKRPVPSNVWLGVTVENKKYGVPRIKDLQAIRTHNKHICCEPLLEDLDELDLTGISLVVGGEKAVKMPEGLIFAG